MVSMRRLAFFPLLRLKGKSHRAFLVSGFALKSLAQQLSEDSDSSSSSSCAPRSFSSSSLLASSDNKMEIESLTGYLDATSAAALDEELMSTPGFTLEQLMELAGLSVAEAVFSVWHEQHKTKAAKILLVCGPGNNGGDGLVAARHLKLFGHQPTIVYPKRSSRQPHYGNLVKQCEDLNIPILDDMPSDYTDFGIIVDAIFGFSFQGEPREPFATILLQMQQAQEKGNTMIVAVDVPSGWNVDEGDVLGTGYVPDVLVSLTAPKLSAKNYPKRHFVGGRFLPPSLAEKYKVRMPPYPGVSQVMEISRGGGRDCLPWEQEYAAYLAEKESQEFASHSQTGKAPEAEGWEKEYAAYLAEKESEQNSS